MADWTLDEARAYLPRLRRLLGIVRQAADVSVRASANGHGTAPSRPPGLAAGPEPPTEADDEAIGPSEALAEIEDRGIVLRDVARGLVDFPSRHLSGRVVLLCWQEGEEDIGWWHLPEDGFAGRRPLPVPPEL